MGHVLVIAFATQGIKSACATRHWIIRGSWSVLVYAVIFLMWTYETSRLKPLVPFIWFQAVIYGLAGLGMHSAYDKMCRAIRRRA